MADLLHNKILIILLAAVLYGISIPFSKIILQYGIEPTMLAAFTYLGAGIGLGFLNFFDNILLSKSIVNPITKKELPYVIAMVCLDIAAIILLMKGVLLTNSANASLLSNFEIAATSIIAFIFFKEDISGHLWFSICIIIIAGIILTLENTSGLKFSIGSILVAASFICWGAENNCTKMISGKNTKEITMIKGISSGIGSLVIALFMGEHFPLLKWCIIIMIMGFFSYGLSVSMYIKSQNHLGAAKTAAYFSIAPFFGVIFSLIFLNEEPKLNFYISFLLMIIATLIISTIRQQNDINTH